MAGYPTGGWSGAGGPVPTSLMVPPPPPPSTLASSTSYGGVQQARRPQIAQERIKVADLDLLPEQRRELTPSQRDGWAYYDKQLGHYVIDSQADDQALPVEYGPDHTLAPIMSRIFTRSSGDVVLDNDFDAFMRSMSDGEDEEDAELRKKQEADELVRRATMQQLSREIANEAASPDAVASAMPPGVLLGQGPSRNKAVMLQELARGEPISVVDDTIKRRLRENHAPTTLDLADVQGHALPSDFGLPKIKKDARPTHAFRRRIVAYEPWHGQENVGQLVDSRLKETLMNGNPGVKFGIDALSEAIKDAMPEADALHRTDPHRGTTTKLAETVLSSRSGAQSMTANASDVQVIEDMLAGQLPPSQRLLNYRPQTEELLGSESRRPTAIAERSATFTQGLGNFFEELDEVIADTNLAQRSANLPPVMATLKERAIDNGSQMGVRVDPNVVDSNPHALALPSARAFNTQRALDTVRGSVRNVDTAEAQLRPESEVASDMQLQHQVSARNQATFYNERALQSIRGGQQRGVQSARQPADESPWADANNALNAAQHRTGQRTSTTPTERLRGGAGLWQRRGQADTTGIVGEEAVTAQPSDTRSLARPNVDQGALRNAKPVAVPTLPNLESHALTSIGRSVIDPSLLQRKAPERAPYASLQDMSEHYDEPILFGM